MDILDREFRSVFEREVGLAKIGTLLIVERFRKAGIRLTAKQRSAIETQLKSIKTAVVSESLKLEITEEQLQASGLSEEQLTNRELDIGPDVEAFVTQIQKQFPKLVRACIKDGARILLRGLKGRAPKMIRDRQRVASRFEKRLTKRWGRSFDLLVTMREIASEAGDEFNNEFRPEATATNDHVLNVLTRLHARACQVSGEIIVLLRAGYADGAHARWRSLHEIAVVGLFIKEYTAKENGADLAERYIMHDAIESYKAAKVYQEYCTVLGAEPLSDLEIAQTKEIRDRLLIQYGARYDEEYGWAAEVLWNKRPTFRDIERAVGLSHLRPYYKLASHNVHANPKGVFFKLGLGSEEQVMLAGPSNAGLADPAHSMAMSLTQITTALLLLQPNLDRIIVSRILMALEKEVGRAVMRAHTRLEQDIKIEREWLDEQTAPKRDARRPGV